MLVGGGHAHVQLLRRWATDPIPGVRLSVVLDQPVAVYSGMVPGLVAGHYQRHELEIDLRPLAVRAGAGVVVARATRLEPGRRAIHLEGRPPLRYDTASFDVGSTVAGQDLPGVRAHALPTRPIREFVLRVDTLVARLRGRAHARVVVVGGGAGGVELAFAFRARLEREGGGGAEVTLLESGGTIPAGSPAGVARRIAQQARRRGIRMRTGARVVAVEPDRVCLEGGEALPCDAVVWVAGAAGLPLFSEVETDAEGFVRVRPTLQLAGCDDVFAAGDCASFAPPLPKAGVYAVRQGPVLAHNLRARIQGRPLRAYRPQRDFLVLLNLGDGSAIGSKWGLSFAGGGAFRLKDWIDRRFVRRFQALTPAGEPLPGFPPLPESSPAEVLCGGCAGKLRQSALEGALARLGTLHDDAVVLGLEAPDDAAAVAGPGGEVVVASFDGFRAFAHDSWRVGRIAAANATSDLFAKGAAPRFALAQVTVPETGAEGAEELLFQLLSGARSFLDAEGVTLVGGHTMVGDELAVGFAVWGGIESADSLRRLGGLVAGQRLVLTKPLGTGVLIHADMRGLARGEWMEAAMASMERSNREAARVAHRVAASAATDVSGFGLAGHLAAMLRASRVSARLGLDAVPLLPGTRELLGRGLRSPLHAANAEAHGAAMRVDPAATERIELPALFDPQTSGGLLLGVAEARLAETLDALREAGDTAAAVGVVVPPEPGGTLIEVVASG